MIQHTVKFKTSFKSYNHLVNIYTNISNTILHFHLSWAIIEVVKYTNIKYVRSVHLVVPFIGLNY